MINNPTIVIPLFLNDLPYFSAFVTNISMLTFCFVFFTYGIIQALPIRNFKKMERSQINHEIKLPEKLLIHSI